MRRLTDVVEHVKRIASTEGREPATIDLGEYRLLCNLSADECAPPKAPHPDAVERGAEIPLGFVPHKDENRVTRLRATATWAPPVIKGEPYWSEPLPAEHFESFRLGQIGNTGDGERVRVTAIDREGMRVHFEPLAEKLPTRRELVKQKQKQRRGKLDPSLRRLQLVAAQRKATK